MNPALVERLQSPDPEARLRACRDAAEHPGAVLFAEALANALGDPVKAVASAASDALASLAQDHAVTDVLHSALHAGEPRRALWAALTLARLEPPGLRALPWWKASAFPTPSSAGGQHAPWFSAATSSPRCGPS